MSALHTKAEKTGRVIEERVEVKGMIDAKPVHSIQPTIKASLTASNISLNTPGGPSVSALTRTVAELRITVDEMQRERDFYFNKLRDIEMIVQEGQEGRISGDAQSVTKRIGDILYATEEGFELPSDIEEDDEIVIATKTTVR